ncbi:uncharacterized protein LOC116288589 isoform X2 [Actinia tenebrosa]|nr:uncharacterized protein LOC116288589 isoform X2 [Actinia tenebrosa]XP_031551256.1 uncharacterized protein LOC116288589 isoform X2 [Actinia tenebrosa]
MEMNLVTRILPFGATKLIFPPEEAEKRKAFQMTENDTMKKHFLVVRVLGKGDFFGLGEHTNNMVVVTAGKVELMHVPRIVLARANRGIILTEMREYLLQSIPSTNQIFHSYVDEIKWKAYKRQMILELLEKRKRKNDITTFKDVPLTIRSAHPDYLTQYAIPPKLSIIPLRA